MLDRKFSIELQDLISHAREIAIDLGYDYISTIHFFLADCESKREDSIITFAFKDETEYQNFRKSYSQEKEDQLDLKNESLPLTKEAETTVILSNTERKLQKHPFVYPSLLFIAALKNKDSLLSKCFEHDENALTDLIKFYDDFNTIITTNITSETLQQENDIKERSTDLNLFARIKRFFTLRK